MRRIVAEGVGRFIREAGLPREELFVTSKQRPRDRGFESTFRSVEETMDRLGVSNFLPVHIERLAGLDRPDGKTLPTPEEMDALF